jgi:hypothetical protein
MLHSFRSKSLPVAAVLLLIIAKPGVASPVLMISVDGMKPEYVLEAERRGLKIPYLKSLGFGMRTRSAYRRCGTLRTPLISSPQASVGPSPWVLRISTT